MIAVILAAGLGTRLEEKTKLKPKGFLEIAGISLIQRSVAILLSKGIQKILIGTGYHSEVYEQFALNYPQIQCIKSDLFETTSSMYTLYNMRSEIENDFLLLESDLLYEDSAIDYLLQDPNEDVILASDATNSGDEVFIETKNGIVKAMSKKRTDLQSIDAELVGISKVSYSLFEYMNQYFEQNMDRIPKLDYEYAIVEGSNKTRPVSVNKVDGLLWCEIDDKIHLARAMHEIWPKIIKKK